MASGHALRSVVFFLLLYIIIKSTADIIVPSLTSIFNLSLSKGIFPQELKMAKVTPLFKLGSRDQAENYHPISVLPVIAKMLEKEVHSQLYKYFTETLSYIPVNMVFGRKDLHKQR
jgi:hypothetical protein